MMGDDRSATAAKPCGNSRTWRLLFRTSRGRLGRFERVYQPCPIPNDSIPCSSLGPSGRLLLRLMLAVIFRRIGTSA